MGPYLDPDLPSKSEIIHASVGQSYFIWTASSYNRKLVPRCLFIRLRHSLSYWPFILIIMMTYDISVSYFLFTQ